MSLGANSLVGGSSGFYHTLPQSQTSLPNQWGEGDQDGDHDDRQIRQLRREVRQLEGEYDQLMSQLLGGLSADSGGGSLSGGGFSGLPPIDESGLSNGSALSGLGGASGQLSGLQGDLGSAQNCIYRRPPGGDDERDDRQIQRLEQKIQKLEQEIQQLQQILGEQGGGSPLAAFEQGQTNGLSGNMGNTNTLFGALANNINTNLGVESMLI